MSAPPQVNGQGQPPEQDQAPDQQQDQQQQPPGPPGPPPLSDGQLPVDPRLVTNALLNAVKQCAAGAAAASGQDAKDFLSAALSGAQAIVILDPSLSQGGTPLAHDLLLERQRGETQQQIAVTQAAAQVQVAHVNGEHALKQAREHAAAPTPVKSLRVSRDGSGRMSGIHQEG